MERSRIYKYRPGVGRINTMADGTRWILRRNVKRYICVGQNNTCNNTAQHGEGTMCKYCVARIEDSKYRREWSEPIGDGSRIRCLLLHDDTGEICGRLSANDQRQALNNRALVEQAAPPTSNTAAEEGVEEGEHPRIYEDAEEPMEQDVVGSRSNEVAAEHNALVARLQADLEQLRTDHETAVTQRDEYQRKVDEANRAREEVESRLVETRAKLDESEKAKAEALKRSEELQVVLDEKDGVVRDALAEKKSRYAFFKKWTDKERQIFKETFDECGKDFVKMKRVLKKRTMKDIVQYYYYTKEKRFKEGGPWKPNKDAGRCTNKESGWQDPKKKAEVPGWSEPEKSPTVE